MDLDALLLSRIQFAFTIAYHIIFPSLSIGLAQLLVFLKAAELITKKPFYAKAWQFWSRIFALSFGMGVVSGVVLSYEIGTNFGKFSEIAGPIVGPLMSYEVMSAFFLEAGFLGIMLLGQHRVGVKLHFFATCMVAFGTLMSAFWILSANSWMHTPTGYSVQDGILMPESWWHIVFNPSFPYRLAHMVCASLLTTAFVVIAISAWYRRNERDHDFAEPMLKIGLAAALVLAPAQIYIGDLHGLNTLEYQPTKVAAMEGNWHREAGAPLLLFALPDQENERNRFEVAIPKLASLILTHSLDGEIPGLTEVPPEDRPPVMIVFWSFRIMVGCGMLMLLLAVAGNWMQWRKRLHPQDRVGNLLLRSLAFAGPVGFIAILAGWVTTESGRQPWVVHGLLRTKDSASLVSASEVATSLVLFVIAYTILSFAFGFFLRHLIRQGPNAQSPQPPTEDGRPAFHTGA